MKHCNQFFKIYTLKSHFTISSIIILCVNVDFNFHAEFIQPICLLESADMNKINFAKSMPYVAGWGSTNSNPNNGTNTNLSYVVEISFYLIFYF